jgi:hypothetical protein
MTSSQMYRRPDMRMCPEGVIPLPQDSTACLRISQHSQPRFLLP